MSRTAPEPGGRRYGGRDAEERRAERREQLLAAALELFGTRGFPAVTIRQLCAEARLAPRYFYEQFTDREELLRTVYDRGMAGVHGAVLAASEAAPPSGPERARALLRAFLEAMTADERLARIAYLEVPGVSHAMEEHRREVVRGFEAFVAGEAPRLAGGGEAPQERDLSLAAMALTGATNQVLQDWLLRSDRAPLERLADELARVYVGALTVKW